MTGESEEALAAGRELATMLGLKTFALDDAQRGAYHAGAATASNFSSRCGAQRLAPRGRGSAAGGLDPLMRRVIENDFELTGPIERGDWETVERHLKAIARRPELERVYRALADLTADQARQPRNTVLQGDGPPIIRTIGELRRWRCGVPAGSASCRRWGRCTRATSPCCAPRGVGATRWC